MRAKNFFIVHLLSIYPFRFIAIPPALVSIMILDSIEKMFYLQNEKDMTLLDAHKQRITDGAS